MGSGFSETMVLMSTRSFDQFSLFSRPGFYEDLVQVGAIPIFLIEPSFSVIGVWWCNSFSVVGSNVIQVQVAFSHRGRSL